MYDTDRIIRNAIKCLECGDTIESEYRHDFKMCSCGNCSVDGGKAYLRRGCKPDGPGYEELSETEPRELQTNTETEEKN